MPPPDIAETLARLDKWVKIIGIAGGALGLALTGMSIWNLYKQRSLQEAQQRLLEHQAQAEVEKRRVNVSMDLKAFAAPVKNKIYLISTLTNHSARQVSLSMIGTRIWNQDWNSDIQDDPSYLVFSDNMVANCPSRICEPAKVAAKTRLSNAVQIVLAPGETQSNTYGPYAIPIKDWSRGVWIEGRAYTEDQDDGKCLIAGPPQLEGTFPAICEESRLNEPDCYQAARCKYASTAAFFYKP
jgi:hypothetical protein